MKTKKENYLDLLFSLNQWNIKLGLTTMKNLLIALGSPEKNFNIVHFAGTNGKGSTLVTLEKLLLASGFTVGSTISPHLISFTERFRINGKPISENILEKTIEDVLDVCSNSIESHFNPVKWKIRPTFFEFSLAIAFLLFKKFEVQTVLLETGLGGRLDATNIIQVPNATVITPIGLDHQNWLGNTLKEITKEKLVIVKPGTTVFISYQKNEVKEQIKNHLVQHNIEGNFYNEDFFFPNDFKNTSLLLGEFQEQNIATAIATYQYLVPAKKQISTDDIKSTLTEVSWPGRLQYVDKKKKY